MVLNSQCMSRGPGHGIYLSCSQQPAFFPPRLTSVCHTCPQSRAWGGALGAPEHLPQPRHLVQGRSSPPGHQ
jgi:hypothetical protein